MSRKRMHPLVEGAAQAIKEIGGKAIRRAVDSVMEDGQRAAEDLQRDIMDARAHPIFDPEIEVRQVNPDVEDDMDRAERRRRERGEREPKPEETDDPPPSGGDIADVQELTDLRDAETFLRHAWMTLQELADSGAYSKDDAKDLESILDALRDQIEERDGV